MKNGRDGISNRISADVKTWDMMKKLTHTLVMPGKHMIPVLSKTKSKSCYESEVTVYECEDCSDCPYKEKCTNINKLHAKIQKERLGSYLFPVKETA